MSACNCEPILAFNYGHFFNGKGFELKVNRAMTEAAASHEPDSVLVDEVGWSYCTDDVAIKYARTRAERRHSDCLACVYRMSAAAANAAFARENDFCYGNIYFDGRCIKQSGKASDRLIMFDGLTMTAHTVGMARAYSKGWKEAEEAFDYKPLTVCACGQPRLAQPGEDVAEGTDWTGFPCYSTEPRECDKTTAWLRLQKGSPVYRYDDKFWTRGPADSRVTMWVVTVEWENDVREVLTLADGRIDMP